MCLPEDTFLIDLESRLKQVFGINNLAISQNESQAKYVLLTLKKLERERCQHLRVYAADSDSLAMESLQRCILSCKILSEKLL